MAAMDLIGRPVTEEEVAVNLGFANVHEMRRWKTEMGQKVANLERDLRITTDERNRFLQHGLKMQIVLQRVAESGVITDPDTRLAAGVVLGKAVDWEHRLKDWFK